jgi:PAS domain S-box-containing protein
MEPSHVELQADPSGAAASLYRSVFERSTDAIAIIAPDGTYVEQNEAHARLTGWPDGDLVGRTPAVHLGETTFAAVLRRLETDGYFFGEVSSLDRDGGVRTVELSAFPVHDARGAIVAYVGAKRDVSARRAAESELRRQFHQLQTMYRMTAALTAAPGLDAIYREALDCLCDAMQTNRASVLLMDPDGVMRFKAWRSLSEGYRRAVEGHNPWSDGSPPRAFCVRDVAADASLGDLRDIILREGIAAAAFVPLLHQGTLLGKFMIYFAQPHELAEDEVRLTESIASHIAVAIARHRDEEAIRAREREFETLAENSPDIITRIDRQLRHVYVNRAIIPATGRQPSDFIGRTNREMGMPSHLVDRWEADLRRVFETARSHSI